MPIKTKRNALTSKLFLAKLASSGLTLDDARRLRIDALDDGGKILPAASGAPVMRLAYADLDGKPTGFYRLRLLADPPGFASALAKPSRYLQPPDTGVAAYLAPGIDWRALSKDTTAPLYITEGELKAASACVRGLPTIGLGGVYSWRSAKSGVAFLPELEAIAWAGRHVFLVFDSDAQTNHQVMRALRHLCRELTDRGAQPYVAKLPPLSDDGKTGLDDLLVAGGTDALSSVLEAAEPFGPAEELWRLNDQVCFVRDPGFVVELATGMRMSVVSFSKEVYANLFYHEREETKAGFRLVKRATAAEWIKWAHRLEAARLTYAPGRPPLTDAGELNTWRGPGIAPRAGDVTPWTRLLDHLFDDERAGRAWFERWCAYPLRHPGTKLLTAAVLWGVHQGTGKSLLGYSLAQLYGERNVSEINQEHLRAPYNDWLVDKQLVLGEEITGSDRRADADKIKALITQRTIRVASKYVREYTVPAVANLFFTSNHPDAFFLEDTDRRFFVHEIKARPLPMSFYRAYATWYRSNAGRAALLHHLTTLDLGDFDPDGAAFETVSKREMIDDNKSDVAAWVHRLRQEPRALLREHGLSEDTALLSAAQLRALYDPLGHSRVTTNGLGRELKRSCVPRLPTVNVTTRDGTRTTMRCYAVQDATRWLAATPGEITAAWEAWFGPDAKR